MSMSHANHNRVLSHETLITASELGDTVVKAHGCVGIQGTYLI